MITQETDHLVRVGPIGPAEFSTVLSVLDAAAASLRARGVVQWPARFDGWRAERIRGEVDRGNVYLVRWRDIPVGTATITDWQDPDFAKGWPEPDVPARYVTRLAALPSARLYVGRSVGALLLERAEAIARTDGVDRVRLDSCKNNPLLHMYFRNNGFTRVGRVDLDHRGSGVLFERLVIA